MGKLKIKLKEQSNNIIDVLPCSLLLTFTFFVFGPLQMYLINKSEFWFELTHILPSIIVSFIIVFIILNLISLLVSKNFKNYYAALLFGIGFALYIQGNFINLDYGVLDGTEIDWNSYGYLGAVNTIFWVLCILSPIILTKILAKQVRKTIKICSLFIVAVQALTIGALLFSTDFSTDKKISVTGDYMFSLSPEKNEIVFILDTFDASYMNNVLEEHPEYKELFSDFTYYNNVIGAYPTTKGALPHILTGEKYDNSVPYSEYIIGAYEKTELYDTLISNGYDVGLYCSKVFISADYADNLINIEKKELQPSSNIKLGLMMYKSTAFSYFPHILKDKFWFYSGDFDQYITISDKKTSAKPYSTDDISFYNSLVEDGLKLDNYNNAFRLYHLLGAHPPYTMTSDLKQNEDGTNAVEESLASLNVVLEYISQLKEAGIYDNTSIIVMGDHGGVEYRHNPMLMVKSANSESEFTISNAPISFDDLLNTMLYLATGNAKYEPNVFSWSENDVRTREYLYYTWDDSWDKDYLPDIYEYTFGGTSIDTLQMNKTGTVYTPNKTIKNYKVEVALGEKLTFPNGGKIQGAFVYGFSLDEGTHIWSLGKKAKLSFALENNKFSRDDQLALILKFKYIYGKSQRIKCFVNGTLIDEKTIKSSSKPILFEFPASLILESDVLEIEFEYPDAFNNPESSESRTLALAFEHMIIDYAKNLLPFIKVGEESIKVDFSENGASDDLINEGWYEQEKNHRWTSEKADITFFSEKAQDYLLTVECLTYSNSGNTHVLYNGEEIALWDKNTKTHKESVILPVQFYDKSGKQTVTFITDDAKSPLESGESKDSRVLGISVKSMTFNVQKP